MKGLVVFCRATVTTGGIPDLAQDNLRLFLIGIKRSECKEYDPCNGTLQQQPTPNGCMNWQEFIQFYQVAPKYSAQKAYVITFINKIFTT